MIFDQRSLTDIYYIQWFMHLFSYNKLLAQTCPARVCVSLRKGWCFLWQEVILKSMRSICVTVLCWGKF